MSDGARQRSHEGWRTALSFAVLTASLLGVVATTIEIPAWFQQAELDGRLIVSQGVASQHFHAKLEPGEDDYQARKLWLHLDLVLEPVQPGTLEPRVQEREIIDQPAPPEPQALWVRLMDACGVIEEQSLEAGRITTLQVTMDWHQQIEECDTAATSAGVCTEYEACDVTLELDSEGAWRVDWGLTAEVALYHGDGEAWDMPELVLTASEPR